MAVIQPGRIGPQIIASFGMVRDFCPTPAQALAVAKSVFATRYANADFAYAAGSIMRGQGRYRSDIDLIVVYGSLDAAHRESFIVEGIPVEAFVHDRETLAWFIDDDVARGKPSILNMIVEGVIIGEHDSQALALRDEVSTRLAEGPPPLSQLELDVLRYAITDMMDDLMGYRGPTETMAIGAMLYPTLVELALRGRARWNGSRKWAPRLLNEVSTELESAFELAFNSLFASNIIEPVVALAEKELEPHDGLLFDGDYRAAPRSWRKFRGL